LRLPDAADEEESRQQNQDAVHLDVAQAETSLVEGASRVEPSLAAATPALPDLLESPARVEQRVFQAHGESRQALLAFLAYGLAIPFLPVVVTRRARRARWARLLAARQARRARRAYPVWQGKCSWEWRPQPRLHQRRQGCQDGDRLVVAAGQLAAHLLGGAFLPGHRLGRKALQSERGFHNADRASS